MVSVIIPTLRRPELVLRAVNSVLQQTMQDFEILVIIDGKDDASEKSLGTITDPRLKVTMNPQSQGPAQARNIGGSQARGTWSTFLDDDDEWLPNKLEEQVRVARELGGDRILLAAQFIDSGPAFERILPLRDPDPGEDMSEYLFCRKGPLRVQGLVQTSTYFVSTRLLQEFPLKAGLTPHEDYDWLMRVSKRCDRPFTVVPGPLSIYHNEQITNREGAGGNFDFHWDYAHRNRELFTPSAFSFYLSVFCTPSAVKSTDKWKRLRMVLRGIWQGKPSLTCMTTFLGFAFFSLETRRKLRNTFQAFAGSKKPA
nr:glycosyltransferase [Granulicella aggregans]